MKRALTRIRRRRGALLGGLAAFLVLGLIACVAEERKPAPPPPELVGEPTIRVLLADAAKTLKIGATGSCQITPGAGEPFVLEKLDETLTPGDGSGLLLGERKLVGATEVRFQPGPGVQLKLEGKPCPGELVVRAQGGGLRAIDFVRAEEYVACVLPGEMPLAWPDAALRAQAIAARTYALWHWKARVAQDHDVKADTRSQVFTGNAPERARKIVQSTEGRVLTSDWRIFETYFMSTCGGETASAEWIFDGPKIAPLAGTVCGKCGQSPHAAWTKELTLDALAKALAPSGVKAPIERIEAIAWPRGNYVRDVKVTHAGGETVLTGPRFRRALELKSTSFGVTTTPAGALLVSGTGWGHGVGLCQWGARGCAESGMDADAIVLKYYPGAVVAKLY